MRRSCNLRNIYAYNDNLVWRKFYARTTDTRRISMGVYIPATRKTASIRVEIDRGTKRTVRQRRFVHIILKTNWGYLIYALYIILYKWSCYPSLLLFFDDTCISYGNAVFFLPYRIILFDNTHFSISLVFLSLIYSYILIMKIWYFALLSTAAGRRHRQLKFSCRIVQYDCCVQ